MAAWIRAVSGWASAASDSRPPGASSRPSSVAQEEGTTGSETSRRSWAARGEASSRGRDTTASDAEGSFIVRSSRGWLSSGPSRGTTRTEKRERAGCARGAPPLSEIPGVALDWPLPGWLELDPHGVLQLAAVVAGVLRVGPSEVRGGDARLRVRPVHPVEGVEGVQPHLQPQP